MKQITEMNLEMKQIVSQAIHHLGNKWNYDQDGKHMINDFCNDKKTNWNSNIHTICNISIAFLFMITAPVIIGIFCISAKNGYAYTFPLRNVIKEEACLVRKPEWLRYSHLTEPRANCHSICEGMEEIPRMDNISPKDFMEKYAFSGRPLILRNVTNGWRAFDTFSFSFFKQVFQPHAENLAALLLLDNKLADDCPFYRYRTEFKNLAEFFNMSEARSRLDPLEKNYYVGWSTCFPHNVNALRSHYTWPNFLPPSEYESTPIDFIFMGSSSEESDGGAPVHIDYNCIPTWQAVIAGRKKWMLYPPPECESVCANKYQVVLEKGDMLVVDTSLWYHATKVYSGILTITIGSDYY